METTVSDFIKKLAGMGIIKNDATTIKKANDAVAVAQKKQPVVTPTPKTTNKTISAPTTNLQPGSTGSTVKQLQDYLVSQGFMTQAQVNTSYGTYGPQTTAAVKKYQEAKGIDNTSGPGYWGPRTIAGSSNPAVVKPPAPVTPAPVAPPKVDPTNPFTGEGLPENFDKWDDTYQVGYLAGVNAQTKAIEAGKVVNPNIELSPAVLKKFKDQAITELDPYYKEKFSLLDNEFNTSIGRLMEDYNKQMGRVDTGFKEKLGAQAGTEAEQGTAFSSGRQAREARTVELANQTLEDETVGVQRSAQDAATSYEKLAGTDRLKSLNIPGLRSFTATNTGVTPGASRTLYNPLGNIAMGDYNKQKTVDISTRASDLENVYRKNRTLDLSTLQ